MANIPRSGHPSLVKFLSGTMHTHLQTDKPAQPSIFKLVLAHRVTQWADIPRSGHPSLVKCPHNVNVPPNTFASIRLLYGQIFQSQDIPACLVKCLPPNPALHLCTHIQMVVKRQGGSSGYSTDISLSSACLPGQVPPNVPPYTFAICTHSSSN